MTRNRSFKLETWLRLVLPLAVALASLVLGKVARADPLAEDLSGLASTDASEVAAAVVKLANRGDARAARPARARRRQIAV